MIKQLPIAAVTLLLAGPVFAEGDAKAGKNVFKKCKARHTVSEGKNKVGPTLYKIVDAPAGAVDGFRYSDALANSGLTWDVETLTAFLAKPRDVVPGNKMSFAGLKKEGDIADVIAYLIDKSN